MAFFSRSLLRLLRLFEIASDFANVGQEQPFGNHTLVARRTQYGRWVHCSEHNLSVFRLDRDTALLHHAERSAEQRLGRRCAEADDDARLNQRDFGGEPGRAGTELTGIRSFVNASFRPRVPGPFEVLDGVRDIDVLAWNARGIERAIQQSAGWSDERAPGLVLGVAWRFADEDHARAARAFAEHRLRGAFVEVAAATGLHRGPKLWQRRARWNEVSG